MSNIKENTFVCWTNKDSKEAMFITKDDGRPGFYQRYYSGDYPQGGWLSSIKDAESGKFVPAPQDKIDKFMRTANTKLLMLVSSRYEGYVTDIGVEIY